VVAVGGGDGRGVAGLAGGGGVAGLADGGGVAGLAGGGVAGLAEGVAAASVGGPGGVDLVASSRGGPFFRGPLRPRSPRAAPSRPARSRCALLVIAVRPRYSS